jgi:Spondin_N
MNAYIGRPKKVMAGIAISAAVLLSACSDSKSPTPLVEYEVTLTNLTAGQPLSPAAVVLHTEQWTSFSTGQAASNELELLAESGDNSSLLASALADNQVYTANSGAGIIAPGESESFQVHTSENNSGTLSLSVLSMLVNTNDAIVALNGKAIGSLAVNESMSVDLLTYDTGTEANTETADTVPGPAASGGNREGYNSIRDDLRDAVYVHSGVVTQDDGLSTSTLTELHRWDNPAVRVRVERLQ